MTEGIRLERTVTVFYFDNYARTDGALAENLFCAKVLVPLGLESC